MAPRLDMAVSRPMGSREAAARNLPDECTGCHEGITYWADPEGTWMECGCDAGYL